MGYVEARHSARQDEGGQRLRQSEREDIARLGGRAQSRRDDVEIYVDANNGYYAKQAIGVARHLADYRVGWFEEPVLADDIAAWRLLRARSIFPCDRRARVHKYGFKELIAAGGVDIVQPT